jgi:2-polyprenyl-6-methoxyphenol hydroxylase-like FAD-dependent oxidoreductase
LNRGMVVLQTTALPLGYGSDVRGVYPTKVVGGKMARMELNGKRVLVVGGATAGAGAALFLARAGAQVTLFERVADPQAVGAGIGMAENGLAVLEALGLSAAIEACARPVPEPRIVDGAGRIVFSPYGPPPRVLMLRRSELQRALLDACAAEARIERRFGAEVTATDPAAGTVTIGAETVRGDLVIGADGVHSRVRASGDHGARERPPGIEYVRVIVPGDHARCEEAWTSEGLFGSFPVSGGQTYVYASAGGPAVKAALAARDAAAFREAWARVYAPAREILGGLARTEDLIVNRVLRVTCARWSDGAQVLVGDAAHAMPPNLGQGANSALVDVAVLYDELRRAADLPAAFAAYQRRRQKPVERVAKMAAQLGTVAEHTNGFIRWIRDRALMPLAAQFAGGAAAQARVLQEPPATLRALGQ